MKNQDKFLNLEVKRSWRSNSLKQVRIRDLNDKNLPRSNIPGSELPGTVQENMYRQRGHK